MKSTFAVCSYKAECVLHITGYHIISSRQPPTHPWKSPRTRHQPFTFGLKLDRILHPNELAVLEQQRRYGNKRNCNESQHAVPPPQAKGCVHGRAGKGQHGAEQTAQTGHAGDGGRGVLREAVDHVGLQGREDAHEAEAEGDE